MRRATELVCTTRRFPRSEADESDIGGAGGTSLPPSAAAGAPPPQPLQQPLFSPQVGWQQLLQLLQHDFLQENRPLNRPQHFLLWQPPQPLLQQLLQAGCSQQVGAAAQHEVSAAQLGAAAQHEVSAAQLGAAAQQLCSQHDEPQHDEPQPLWHPPNKPCKPPNRPQLFLQPPQPLLQQLLQAGCSQQLASAAQHEVSAAQDGAAAQQLVSAAQHDASAQQLGAAQQLASQQLLQQPPQLPPPPP